MRICDEKSLHVRKGTSSTCANRASSIASLWASLRDMYLCTRKPKTVPNAIAAEATATPKMTRAMLLGLTPLTAGTLFSLGVDVLAERDGDT